MKFIFNFRQFLNFEKVLFYALVLMLSLLCLRINIIQQAIGAESPEEPHISVKAKNQPLGDVLKKITLDTGFKFELDDQWRIYPVNISFEDMPLHRGLKLILKGLNHSIIYESDKSIKIMVYGKVDSRKTDSSPTQPFSSEIQEIQQEPTPPLESSSDKTDDLKRADDSSEETSSSENMKDKSTENEHPSNIGKHENSKETATEINKELDQDSTVQTKNTNE